MFNEDKPVIAYYDVIWFVNGCRRLDHTDSSVASDELLELLSMRKAQKGDIDSCFVVGHEAADFFSSIHH